MTPNVVCTVAELRSLLDSERSKGSSIGFTPTMGYLHDGHGSLMQAARSDCDFVVASIFVNPLQFAPNEDLSTYPRDLDRDVEIAGSNGTDVIFHPPVKEMYPNGDVLTSVSVNDLSSRWDGESRPTHFAGVATVVTKLLNIVGPCRAYFGEKDFQQLTILRRMVSDLSIPVEVVGCPIVREPDGLAMSSRNIFLSPDERVAALVLRRSLDAGVAAAAASSQANPATSAAITAAMTHVVEAEPLAELDYVAAVDPQTLDIPADGASDELRLLIAVRVGETRLIDNCAASVGR